MIKIWTYIGVIILSLSLLQGCNNPSLIKDIPSVEHEDNPSVSEKEKA